MPPPSPIAIATSSLTRLTKEESSYRTELASQQKRLQSLQASTAPDEDGNRDFQIEQEKRAVKETEAVFGPLRKRIETAVEALESLLEASEEGRGDGSGEGEVERAREVVGRVRGGVKAQGL